MVKITLESSVWDRTQICRMQKVKPIGIKNDAQMLLENEAFTITILTAISSIL